MILLLQQCEASWLAGGYFLLNALCPVKKAHKLPIHYKKLQSHFSLSRHPMFTTQFWPKSTPPYYNDRWKLASIHQRSFVLPGISCRRSCPHPNTWLLLLPATIPRLPARRIGLLNSTTPTTVRTTLPLVLDICKRAMRLRQILTCTQVSAILLCWPAWLTVEMTTTVVDRGIADMSDATFFVPRTSLVGIGVDTCNSGSRGRDAVFCRGGRR